MTEATNEGIDYLITTHTPLGEFQGQMMA